MKYYDIFLRGHHLRLLYGFCFAGRKDSIRNTAIKDHNERHANNVIAILSKIAESKVKIKITDTLDDICQSCNMKNRKICKEFIPHDISAVADDRGTAHYYGLKINKIYIVAHILRQLKKVGRWG